jgi:hypothetical protein
MDQLAELAAEWKHLEWDKGHELGEREARGPKERKRRNARYKLIERHLRNAFRLIEEAGIDERDGEPLMRAWRERCWEYCRDNGIEVRAVDEDMLDELFPEALRLLVEVAEGIEEFPHVPVWTRKPRPATVPPQNDIKRPAELYDRNRLWTGNLH